MTPVTPGAAICPRSEPLIYGTLDLARARLSVANKNQEKAPK